VLALGSLGLARAATIDLATGAGATATPVGQGHVFRVPDLAVTPGVFAVLPGNLMSELPEPEVFAMMLVGLVLIGYRASRDSSEKFK
jgi:hypothetical protein